MTLPAYFTMQSIMTGQTALVSASLASREPQIEMTSVTAGATGVIDEDNEPTNPMIPFPEERTIVDNGPIPAHIGLELIEYGIPSHDIDRLSGWMDRKGLRLHFMTKAIEYLGLMRREERMDDEITQVMPAAARRHV